MTTIIFINCMLLPCLSPPSQIFQTDKMLLLIFLSQIFQTDKMILLLIFVTLHGITIFQSLKLNSEQIFENRILTKFAFTR